MAQFFQCGVKEPHNTDVLEMHLSLNTPYHHKSELDVISMPVVGFVRLKYFMQMLRLVACLETSIYLIDSIA